MRWEKVSRCRCAGTGIKPSASCYSRKRCGGERCREVRLQGYVYAQSIECEEPCEGRLSRTVLWEGEGETPSLYSTLSFLELPLWPFTLSSASFFVSAKKRVLRVNSWHLQELAISISNMRHLMSFRVEFGRIVAKFGRYHWYLLNLHPKMRKKACFNVKLS